MGMVSGVYSFNAGYDATGYIDETPPIRHSYQPRRERTKVLVLDECTCRSSDEIVCAPQCNLASIEGHRRAMYRTTKASEERLFKRMVDRAEGRCDNSWKRRRREKWRKSIFHST